jgi:pilus assembly protein CpaB
MGGGLLRKLSIATVALAALLGLYAYQLGRELTQPAPSAASPQLELPKVVAAARALEAGTALRPGDVMLAPIGMAPAGAFARAQDVIERVTVVDLAAGEPILEKHFSSASALRRSLLAGERALAVKVDGVIGLGGFVEPGDRVDVLLYLAQDGREVPATQARLLLSDLRVLAFGPRTLGKSGDGAPIDARTAVLAVPEPQVSMLLLGASKGRLRLALRGAAETGNGAAAREGQVASLANLLGGRPEPRGPVRRRVVIHRGDAREEAR